MKRYQITYKNDVKPPANMYFVIYGFNQNEIDVPLLFSSLDDVACHEARMLPEGHMLQVEWDPESESAWVGDQFPGNDFAQDADLEFIGLTLVQLGAPDCC